MARFILDSSGSATVGGQNITVFGTAESETVTIVNTDDGDISFDQSFNSGGDTIAVAGEAEEYTAVREGSRLILTNTATGSTISIPVGGVATTIEFGGDDPRELMFMDGALMFGGAAITDTEVTLEPGDDDASNLTASLQSLQGANAALDAFLEAQPEDADTETEIEGNLTTLQGELAALPTAAQLQARLDVAQSDLDAVEADIAAVDGLEEAIATLEAATLEEETTNAELSVANAEYNAAAARFEAFVGGNATLIRNSNGTVDLDDGTTLTSVIELDDDGNLVLADAYSSAQGSAALLTASQDLEDAEAAEIEANTALSNAQASVSAIPDGDQLYTQLVQEEADVTQAEADVTARAELAQEVADAQAVSDQLDALQADVAAAEAEIEALGFETPVTVDDTSTSNGTEASDIFVLSTGDGTGSATINGFGAEGDDVLFIGGNTYTVVNVDADTDISNTDVGNVGVLEVFVQQDGDNTVMFFEDETFSGSASNNSFQGFTLTLNDVDATNVSFDSTGYISLDDSAMMA
ncbi:hypothetical protein [Croceicoccus hydrothermalis]|uniref:hypothetical protein n=1 Tax=Croceicoccus hydrothermalis TaxID=2867964 RepID=UPI001EFB1017|nr:hypothetical protein [Croceicoccus hydrothermalis]